MDDDAQKRGTRAALKQTFIQDEYDKPGTKLYNIREEVLYSRSIPGLTDKQKDDLVVTQSKCSYSDCMFDENMKSCSRYRDLNNDNVNERKEITKNSKLNIFGMNIKWF